MRIRGAVVGLTLLAIGGSACSGGSGSTKQSSTTTARKQPLFSAQLRLSIDPPVGVPGTKVSIVVTGCNDPTGNNHAVSFNNNALDPGARNNPGIVQTIAVRQTGDTLTGTYVIRPEDQTGRTGMVFAQCGGTVKQAVFVVDVKGSTTPTSAAKASSLPSAINCNPGRGDPGSGVKPSLIFFGCATSADNLGDIRWATWTATTATGTATHNRNDCIDSGPNPPSCAAGGYKHYPVNVTLSDPGTVNGVYVFRTITLRPTSVNEAPEATRLYCGPDGSPPQNHCDASDSWGFVTS